MGRNHQKKRNKASQIDHPHNMLFKCNYEMNELACL